MPKGAVLLSVEVGESIVPQEQGCPACGGKLSKLGEDVSEVLEYVPHD